MKEKHRPVSEPNAGRSGLRVPTPKGGDVPLTAVPQPGTPITPASVEKLRQALREGRIPKAPKR